MVPWRCGRCRWAAMAARRRRSAADDGPRTTGGAAAAVPAGRPVPWTERRAAPALSADDGSAGRDRARRMPSHPGRGEPAGAAVHVSAGHRVPPPLRVGPGRAAGIARGAARVRRDTMTARSKGVNRINGGSSGGVRGPPTACRRRSRVSRLTVASTSVAVELELAGADARQRRQLAEVGRPRLGDGLQGGVGEDDVRRHRRRLRRLAPPGPQPLEQLPRLALQHDLLPLAPDVAPPAPWARTPARGR